MPPVTVRNTLDEHRVWPGLSCEDSTTLELDPGATAVLSDDSAAEFFLPGKDDDGNAVDPPGVHGLAVVKAPAKAAATAKTAADVPTSDAGKGATDTPT